LGAVTTFSFFLYQGFNRKHKLPKAEVKTMELSPYSLKGALGMNIKNNEQEW
jgi:hypothetical protein